MSNLVVVRGAGDLASGIIHKLYEAGFDVVALEIKEPTAIRRNVAFSEAVFDGKKQVEGVTAFFCKNKKEVIGALKEGVAIIVDPEMTFLGELDYVAFVDATLAKKNMAVSKDLADVVIGVGPGFTADKDVHAVIETCRGHNLGRIYYEGKALENTGVPGVIEGYSKERVIRSPIEGKLRVILDIKGICEKGQRIAMVDDEPIYATFNGLVRGMIREGALVTKDMKIADIDPRIAEIKNCDTISDKARCIAGGVLEAIMHLRSERNE